MGKRQKRPGSRLGFAPTRTRLIDRTNAPGTCLWCGVKLQHGTDGYYAATEAEARKLGEESGREIVSVKAQGAMSGNSAWRCEVRHKYGGAYSDGSFCTQGCGFAFGQAAAMHGFLLAPYKEVE